MSKYNNRKTKCLSKHLHASKFEAGYCNRLLAMRQKGEIFQYAEQIPFYLPGGIIHIVDFVVQKKYDGGALLDHCEVHECKGFATAAWKMKRKLFEEKYPHIPYIVIYQNKHKSKRRKKWPKKIMTAAKVLR